MSARKDLEGMTFTKQPGKPNQMLRKDDDFYISFLPAGSIDIAMFEADDQQAETMLRVQGLWLGLNGDFRREYEEAFPDPYKCLAVYDKYKADARSSWSTDDTDNIDKLAEWLKRRVESFE